MWALAVLIAVKASLAVLLLVAGLSKARDLAAFRESVTVLAPRLARLVPSRTLAAGVAGVELLAGALSLALPTLLLADVAVLGLCVAFLVVSTVGSLRHRGVSCRCFGALSDQRFGPASVARSAGLVVAAGMVVAGHQSLAAMPLPSPWEWVLVVLALTPVGIAFVLAGKVLRAARDQEVPAR
jgi:hypothetical protein